MLIAMAFAEEAQAVQNVATPPAILQLLPFFLMIVIFYFLLFLPQQKRQKEHEKMLKGLKKNDEVITSGGIHGTIVNLKDTSITLKVDENVKIELEKGYIATVTKKAN